MYVQIYRGKKQRERWVISSQRAEEIRSQMVTELSMEKSVGGVQAASPCEDGTKPRRNAGFKGAVSGRLSLNSASVWPLYRPSTLGTSNRHSNG